MRLQSTVFLLALVVTSGGCNSSIRESRKASPAQQQAQAVEESAIGGMSQAPASRGRLPKMGGGGGGGYSSARRSDSDSPGVHTDSITDDASAVSLASISTVYAASETIDRKIIRNGE